MYKWIGFFCILAGCAGWGNTRAALEKERVGHLRILFHILGQMRGEISYGKHTLPEVCLLLSELNDGCYKKCFSGIYEQTREENGGDFAKVWETELTSCLEGLPLGEDDGDVCWFSENVEFPGGRRAVRPHRTGGGFSGGTIQAGGGDI